MNIREKCEGCGMCCRAIYLSLNHSELSDDLEKFKENKNRERIQYDPDYKVSEEMDDRTFVKQNWYPLTREEVKERNPWLYNQWMQTLESNNVYTEDEIDQIFNTHFYGCSQLNEETGRCMTHENTAKVCSGYPWYGKRPSESTLLYTEDCYYKRDLSEEALAEFDRLLSEKVAEGVDEQEAALLIDNEQLVTEDTLAN